MKTMAELMAALPHVLAAPKDETRAGLLTFRPARNERLHPDSLTLTVAEGIPGDRWLSEPWLTLEDGSPDPDIQVSILPQRVYDLICTGEAAGGGPMVHPGDTVIADLDTSLANLPEGTILQAGSAKLRVSAEFNDGCVKWKVRYGKDAKDWITRDDHPPLRLRGVLCAIVEDGILRQGDEIRVISRPQAAPQ